MEVSESYVGNESMVGCSDVSESIYFSRVVCTHFDDGDVVFVCELQEGDGDTYMVVEVALGVKDVIFGGKDGGEEFFSGCFSVGAGDGEDGGVEFLSVEVCELLESGEAVVDEDIAFVVVDVGGWLVDDGVRAALLEGVVGERVAVEVFAFKGEEDGVWGTESAVGGYVFVFEEELIDVCDGHLVVNR